MWVICWAAVQSALVVYIAVLLVSAVYDLLAG
jgi:hypothetical protein